MLVCLFLQTCGIHKTIFIGAIDYSLLIDIYMERTKEEHSLMSKVKRFWDKSGSNPYNSHTLPTRYYVKMNGPNSKGSAEVAIYQKVHDPSSHGMEEMTTFSNSGVSSRTNDEETAEDFQSTRRHELAGNGKKHENREGLSANGKYKIPDCFSIPQYPPSPPPTINCFLTRDSHY